LESLIQILEIFMGKREGLDGLDGLANTTEWHLGRVVVISVTR
jgi:hypothetical protein